VVAVVVVAVDILSTQQVSELFLLQGKIIFVLICGGFYIEG
jgi:hypothetical protein